MSESALIWFEVIFNVAYLIAIWGIVFLMTRHKDRVAPQDRREFGGGLLDESVEGSLHAEVI